MASVIGRALETHELKPELIVVVKPPRHDLHVTAWVKLVTDGSVVFYASKARWRVICRRKPDGTIVDDQERAVQVFQYLGNSLTPESQLDPISKRYACSDSLWTLPSRPAIFPGDGRPIRARGPMVTYTVILLCPEFIQDQDVYVTYPVANDVPAAIEQAQVIANKENEIDGDPAMWRPVFVCEGMAPNIKDQEAPKFPVYFTRRQIRALYRLAFNAVDTGSNIKAEVVTSALEQLRQAARDGENSNLIAGGAGSGPDD